MMRGEPNTSDGSAGSNAKADTAESWRSQMLAADAQAEESIRFQAQLLNAVEQAIVATDLTGRVIFWNRFAETLYGWTAEEVLGRDIVEVSSAPAFTEPARDIMAQLRRGESWSGEHTVRRRDGTTFIAHVLDSPILDEQGTLIGIAGISRDITEQKQIQEANRLLAEASALLAGTADYEAQLDTWRISPCRTWQTGARFTCSRRMARSGK